MILLLSVCFGLGMMLADTGNGLIMHWLVQRSEAMALQAARLMSGVIALLALMVVIVGHGSHHFQQLGVVWAAWGAWIGVGVTGIAILAYAWSHWRFRHRSRTPERAWREDQADAALSSAAVPRPAASAFMPLR
jgi:O-antigen/teichoic acid export membrane protein